MNRGLMAIALASGLLVGVAGAATTGLTPGWDGGTADGWMHYDLANQRTLGAVDVRSGAVRVVYPAQTLAGLPEETMVKAEGGASGGAFTGDYRAAGVQGCALRLRVTARAETALLLQGANGHWWMCALESMATGAWHSITVPLAAGVWRNLDGPTTASALASDLAQVQWFGVMLRRASGGAAEEIELDDVSLLGLDPRFAEWGETYGALEAGDDLDGDGLSNYGEWMAGTKPDDPDDSLRVRVEPRGGGMAVSWEGREARVYRMQRAPTAGGPFMEDESVLMATPPRNEVMETPEAGAPCFYRVRVTREDLP